MGGIVVDSFFYFNMFRNIISQFFQDGIWVVGFFFLLIKTFESDRLKQFSKYVMGTVLILIICLFSNGKYIRLFLIELTDRLVQQECRTSL